jgi:hypothetical protein
MRKPHLAFAQTTPHTISVDCKTDEGLLELGADSGCRAVVIAPRGYVLYLKRTSGLPTIKSKLGRRTIAREHYMPGHGGTPVTSKYWGPDVYASKYWPSGWKSPTPSATSVISGKPGERAVTFHFDPNAPTAAPPPGEDKYVSVELCIPESTPLEVHALGGSQVSVLGDGLDSLVVIKARPDSNVLVAECTLDIEVLTTQGKNPVLARAYGEYGLFHWEPCPDGEKAFLLTFAEGRKPDILLPNAIQVCDNTAIGLRQDASPGLTA